MEAFLQQIQKMIVTRNIEDRPQGKGSYRIIHITELARSGVDFA